MSDLSKHVREAIEWTTLPHSTPNLRRDILMLCDQVELIEKSAKSLSFPDSDRSPTNPFASTDVPNPSSYKTLFDFCVAMRYAPPSQVDDAMRALFAFMDEEEGNFHVACGICGGEIYFLTCPRCNGDWVIASECMNCGEVVAGIKCPACDAMHKPDEKVG